MTGWEWGWLVVCAVWGLVNGVAMVRVMLRIGALGREIRKLGEVRAERLKDHVHFPRPEKVTSGDRTDCL